MKNKKIKIAYLLTTFIFLFTYIGGLIGSVESYAYDSTYILLASSSKNSPKSSRKNYSIKPKSTIKPSSGSFSTNSKNNSSNKNTTTIKPDSGSFSTKPNTNTNNSGSSSTTKPDSGTFSTNPKNNSNSSNNSNTNTNTNNRDYGNSTSSRRPIFGGSYYGRFSPFRRVFFGYGMSSWIVKIVVLITIIVIIYIVIDYIRSKRD